MKSNQTEKAERLFTALGDLDPKTVASAAAYIPKTTRKGRGRRILVAVLAATLCVCLVTLTVFAAVPSLRRMLNLPFLSESERQDTVPEGWVGIYTVEDLDNIRNDLDGKYILMNDLTFADGAAPFDPIGSADTPFVGQLDGNGYVIRGLVIEVEQEMPELKSGEKLIDGERRPCTYYDIYEKMREPLAVGLFGYCSGNRYDEEDYHGMIANLGIEGATVTVTNASVTYVGVLAGSASYLAGCYVKDSVVTVSGYDRAEADQAQVYLHVGGLVGNVDLVDSCYAANTRVHVTDTADLDVSQYSCLMGGMVGNAYTVVTSYTEACATFSDHAEATKGDLWGHIHLLHRWMNETQYYMVYERYYRATHEMTEDEPLPEDWLMPNIGPEYDWATFLCRKFASYYIPKTLGVMIDELGYDFDDLDPALLMGDFTPEYIIYMGDSTMTMQEIMMIEEELTKNIGPAVISEIMTCENMKVGPLDCYTLAPAKSYKESDFAEFDFDTIWEMKDGRPVLRIFEN